LKITESIIQGDIRNPETIAELSKVNADCVIYTISLDHRDSEGDFSKVIDVNVRPLENFLRACGGNLKRIIYFSTVQVYGRELDGAVSENDAVSPGNMYGLTHLFCEQICDLYRRRSGVDAINLRFSNIFGAPTNENKGCWPLVINDLCKQAFLNRKIILQSDGSPVRDFLPLSDFLEAACFFIENEGLKYSAYNVASGNSITILGAARIVSEIASRRFQTDIPVLYDNRDLRSEIPCEAKFRFDNTRLKSAGFKLTQSLDNEIEKLFDYLENKCQK
jgi:UDP-glucose 4-epimerase